MWKEGRFLVAAVPASGGFGGLVDVTCEGGPDSKPLYAITQKFQQRFRVIVVQEASSQFQKQHMCPSDLVISGSVVTYLLT